jgi:hypothetical protein
MRRVGFQYKGTYKGTHKHWALELLPSAPCPLLPTLSASTLLTI